MSLRYASLKDIPAHLLRERGLTRVEPIERPKRPKYGNRAAWRDGKRFDSELEARCYDLQVLRWKAGEILWFTRQCPFELPGGVKYRADFVVALKAGGVEVIDAKGKDTRESINKRKQVKALYGIDVQLWADKA
jgi:hypothetical protein